MKRYIVTQNQPTRFGLTAYKYEWKFILDTDNLKTAWLCAKNWQRFNNYNVQVIDCTKCEVLRA